VARTRRWLNQYRLLGGVLLVAIVLIGAHLVPTQFNQGAAPSGVQAFSSLPSNLQINFTESGLPNGTTWGVTLGTVTKLTNSSAVPFLVSNGSHDGSEPFVVMSASNASNSSYAFVVASPAGYTPSPASGVLHPQSQGQTISVRFTLNDSGMVGVSPRVDSLSGTLIAAAAFVLLGVAGAAIGLALVLGGRRRNLPAGLVPIGAGVLVLPPPPPPAWSVDDSESGAYSTDRPPLEATRPRSRHPYS
jgi:hypothetical protein